jgi:hypothetical protein
LSNKAITDYSGPDFYHWSNSEGTWSNTDMNNDQANIYTFMTNNYGLGISMPNGPTAEAYLGFNDGFTGPDSNIINYTYYNT